MRNFALTLICLGLGFGNMNGQTVGIFLNDSLAFNGYTLLAPNGSMTSWLIDNCGYVVHTWESEYTPGLSTYLMENGDLVRTERIFNNFSAGGSGGRVERINWEGEVLWGYDYSSDIYHQHHDVEVLPNGNILIIAWEKHTEAEAIEAGRNPATLTPAGIWSERVVEVKPIGTNEIEVVWEWHLWDHLIQDFDPTKDNYGVVKDHPELMDINYTLGGGIPGGNADWIHFNSVDYNPELDQIILSSRHMSEVWIIDHSTTSQEAAGHIGGLYGKGGDLLYRWGNPEAYQHDDTGTKTLFGQHDAQWIPNDYENGGSILVFNNGGGRPGGSYSSADVFTPPSDGNGNYTYEAGQAYGPTELDWTFSTDPPGEMFSNTISGAQRLANGNTLICEGSSGHLREVTLDGELVWEYISPVSGIGPVDQGQNPFQNSVFRAYRFPLDYPAFDGRDLFPGPPIEGNPTNQDCVIYGENVSVTTTTIEPANISLIGNPVQGSIRLNNPEEVMLQLQLFHLSGQAIAQKVTRDRQVEWLVENWGPGLYVLRILDEDGRVVGVEKVVNW